VQWLGLLTYVSVYDWMTGSRTPEQLRAVAEQCRSLAASCITAHARQPLNEMADELEEAADEQRILRERLIGGITSSDPRAYNQGLPTKPLRCCRSGLPQSMTGRALSGSRKTSKTRAR
jgi:hypothetical protein